MTRMNSGRSPVPGRPQNDIYTALLAIAAAFVLAGTIYLAVQLTIVFGSMLPPSGG